MVTRDEITEIINLSFQYILAIVDHLSIDYNFQLDFYLYEAFKKAVRKTFLTAVASADWPTVCKPDEGARMQLEEVDAKIIALTESLDELRSMDVRG